MGLTKHSFDLMNKHCNLTTGTMLELGDQIIYWGNDYGTYSTPWFQKNFPSLEHICIDIKPEKYAVAKDLRVSLGMGEFDYVTNFGTTEHVAQGKEGGLYEAYKNVHEACKVGGVMIHENPKTGNWPGHGDHYMTKDFYTKFALITGYEILELGEHAAMGNSIDGWNIYCVLRKVNDTGFCTKAAFNLLDFRTS